MNIQELNLKLGQRANCTAGHPHKGTIVIECIKAFDSAISDDHIINNTSTYVKIVDGGRFGALTSHWISSQWNHDVRFFNQKDGTFLDTITGATIEKVEGGLDRYEVYKKGSLEVCYTGSSIYCMAFIMDDFGNGGEFGKG